ncbi:MAG: hypothetical protein CMM83_04115 [Rhodospirillales bacterium]|nr:hypothetical protein [Rhodospirillales bacterium]|tara:strand:- start:1558 stop:1788 length:231 start_codon:yes stop_codon:yes gene_type:complete
MDKLHIFNIKLHFSHDRGHLEPNFKKINFVNMQNIILNRYTRRIINLIFLEIPRYFFKKIVFFGVALIVSLKEKIF